jgi:hypothetical protein
MVGDGAAMLIARAFDAAACPDASDAPSPVSFEIYDSRLLRFTRPYDGIPALLGRCETVLLAVLTNKPLRRRARFWTESNSPRTLATACWAATARSPRKPDPSGL